MLFLPPVFGTKLGSNTWVIFRRQADIRLIEEMLLVDAIRKLRQVADREITLPGFEGVEGLLIQILYRKGDPVCRLLLERNLQQRQQRHLTDIGHSDREVTLALLGKKFRFDG